MYECEKGQIKIGINVVVFLLIKLIVLGLGKSERLGVVCSGLSQLLGRIPREVDDFL